MSPTLRQVAVVFQRELRKTFLARRGLWIYLLALAPLALFFAARVQLGQEARQRQALAAQQQKHLTPGDFYSIHRGMSEREVIAQLGPPPERDRFVRRRRGPDDEIHAAAQQWFRYSDGSRLYTVVLEDGFVTGLQTRSGLDADESQILFASVFQFFFLRLAVFFGCLGIFMNLFRGELLDKSLHFYFLAPVRREVVLAGKFLAGLAAAVAVFGGSVVLQLALLGGPSAGQYLGVTALACLGYGVVFLAAGLLWKHPVVPALALLVWESLVPFLPAALQRISVIYYLTQLCPIPVASSPGTSPLLAVLVAAAAPISKPAAVLGLLLLAALLLLYSARRVRRLEIDYTAD